MASGEEARRRSLQDGEREAHGGAPPLLARPGQPVGPVHLLPHILCDLVVEGGFRVGERVVDRVGQALGEERRPIELEELFLDQPAHQVGGVDVVDATAEPAFEAVPVQQRHEELEVLRLATVRCRAHEQEMPS